LGAPFFMEIAGGVQTAESRSLYSFGMTLTRPTETDDTNIVIVHRWPGKNREKRRGANANRGYGSIFDPAR
jgi:hypothetical protein